MIPPRAGSLVLYKGRPALVAETGKKLTIRTAAGPVSVRPKDIALLHPGPLATLPDFKRPPGDPQTAWELLAGQSITLPELAELVYGDYTPQTAWAAWELVDDGLYFSGDPEAIAANQPQVVAEIRAAREAKAAEAAAWSAFTRRLAQGRIQPDDRRYLAEVEDVALDRALYSLVLRQLGRAESPESAHALLLETGVWDETADPYPERARLPRLSPDIAAGPLPDEARLDLTHLTALAIDDEGSSDPDDALSYDGELIWVHIADAAALVPPDSPLDLEARERAANLYLPTGTSRMLPDAATDTLALGLSETSPALSFSFRLNEEAAPVDLTISPSMVRVTRLSYEAAELLLDESPLAELAAEAVRYQGRRAANGAVEIDLPEARVRVSEGRVTVRPLANTRSREVVREAMLMAGEAVAAYCTANDIPVAYSTQPPPWPVEDPPDGLAGMFAYRRGMQRGVYRARPEPHAGLGLDRYVQATSPLRRYLDLVAHQQLRAFLRGETLLSDKDIMQRIATMDATLGAIRATERQSNRHWTLVYLLQNPEWQGEGVVAEQRQGRDLVLIPGLALEEEVYGRRGRRLNDRVTLSVESIDLPALAPRFREIVPPVS